LPIIDADIEPSEAAMTAEIPAPLPLPGVGSPEANSVKYSFIF